MSEYELKPCPFKLGDWIHSSSGVGQVQAIKEGVPWILAGNSSTHGFPCFRARLATDKEIAAAKQGRYIIDPDAGGK